MHRPPEVNLRMGTECLRQVSDPYIVAWLEIGWTGIGPANDEVRSEANPGQGARPFSLSAALVGPL